MNTPTRTLTGALVGLTLAAGVGIVSATADATPRRSSHSSSSENASATTPRGCVLPEGGNGTAWQDCTEREIAALPWCGVDVSGVTPWRPSEGGTGIFISGYAGTTPSSVNFVYRANTGTAQAGCNSIAIPLSATDMHALASSGGPEDLPTVLQRYALVAVQPPGAFPRTCCLSSGQPADPVGRHQRCHIADLRGVTQCTSTTRSANDQHMDHCLEDWWHPHPNDHFALASVATGHFEPST